MLTMGWQGVCASGAGVTVVKSYARAFARTMYGSLSSLVLLLVLLPGLWSHTA